MRTTMLAFVAVLAVAGCGSSNNTGNDGMLSLDGGNHDLTQTGGQMDLTAAKLNCGEVIQCTNMAMNQTQFQNCIKMGTTQAQTAFNNLNKCLLDTCFQAPDGGMGACGNGMSMSAACANCFGQVQSGKSPSGMSNGMCCLQSDPSNGMCTMQDTTGANPAPCGQCVDELAACANDMSAP